MSLTMPIDEEAIILNINERIVKNFLDIIIMNELRNGSFSGYDLMNYIHNKFQLLISSGTIYSLLYSLERNELVKGTWTERKRTYQLTLKGTKTIQIILSTTPDITYFTTNFLKIP